MRKAAKGRGKDLLCPYRLRFFSAFFLSSSVAFSSSAAQGEIQNIMALATTTAQKTFETNFAKPSKKS